ncbi:putative bifunctional diguanylate cyclase/phosphodiesterase [Xanthobacter tagetidis]|jgi:diguanylate cyclase (GGDEF)-like protein|uniref:EAL domain-containing protein n=1 Tax=Xanthobacter tagetidis TaxID=60216 RepID=A0A3L7AA66_9HYPH|nr:EAL domain-containing protein [Xanthobacter tagetidis]MBB6309385.1 diguanylate cyclase (GGDEF)-like protein [Xanthobacter tagetidis]RLP76690.1 EAL domain-containing protein [Xanthobacter tagetidis]
MNPPPHAPLAGEAAAEPRIRRDIAYALIIIATLASMAVLIAIDAFELFRDFTRAHEIYQLDEILWIGMVGSFALAAVLILRSRDLSREAARRRQAEAAVEDLSRYDALTGVANRQMFREELKRHLDFARMHDTRLALLVVDIDRFISVNDLLGHAGGDRILRAFSDRVRSVLRLQDVLARLGSDEFAILFPLTDGAGIEDIFRIAERIVTVARQPFPDESGRATGITVSIGIAMFPRDATDDNDLLLHAEAAMLQAKAAGRNRYILFDGALDARRRQRLELEAEIRTALVNDEIVAHYQPLVSLSSLNPVGFEALARWQHPKRGLLGPAEFVPIIEDIGLNDALLRQMVSRVCRDTRDWPEHLTIAINSSPPQLVEEGFAQSILDLLDEYGFPPRRLEVEITETALLIDFDAARRSVAALKAKGVRVSLDDFGTGYSSLTHLHQLPFDKLKIDASFTRGIGEDSQIRKIIASMIGLGHALRLVTVAEGVETREQAEWLRSRGCELAQGYAFARPLPPEEAERLIAGGPVPVAVARPPAGPNGAAATLS